MKRIISTALMSIAGVYLVGCSCLLLGQDRLVYFPTKEITWTPAQAGFKYDDVMLVTEGRQSINAWFVTKENARGTILLAHGNGENIGNLFDYVEFYTALGMNVMLFDYRGYGRSEGRPTEKATYEDIMACWKYLTYDRGLAPSKIVIVGRSLGGGVASWLAVRVKPAGLALDSTFTSVPDVGAEVFPWLPVRLLARIYYDTKDIIAQMKCPVLIAHSSQDEVIPYKHGRRLYDLAKEPKSFVEMKGGHNSSPWERGNDYPKALDEFLTRCLAGS
jgi:hypothetical protein